MLIIWLFLISVPLKAVVKVGIALKIITSKFLLTLKSVRLVSVSVMVAKSLFDDPVTLFVESEMFEKEAYL